MKKILFSLFAIAMMLFATSCSQEESFAPVADGTEVPVVFSAQLPKEMVTRVYSDGKTAKTLHYAVYRAGSNEPKFQTTAQFDENLQAQVNLTLATGLSYDIIFWAQSDAANEVYSLDWEAKTMTVNYNKMKANDENNDAFYAYRSNLKVNGAITEDIELYRPFAQINLGTNDFDLGEKAGLFPDRSSMKANLPNVLNLVDGSVSGEAEVTIGVNAFSTTETFPVTGYDYLEMNYVLTGETKNLIDCTFSIWEKNASVALNPAITVSNVPVQRNYRTNIYGALLTDPAAFEVEIIPAYNEPDYDKEHDNEGNPGGNTPDTPEVPAEDYTVETTADGRNHYIIHTAEGLAEVSALMNEAENGSEIYKSDITLQPLSGNVLDMAGIDFEPIGMGNSHDGYLIADGGYQGTFDGNGIILKNLTIDRTDSSADNYKRGDAGLVHRLYRGGVIKNVILEECNIKGKGVVGGIAGRSLTGQIINCHIIGGTIVSTTGSIYSLDGCAGGIIGTGGGTTIGCTVEGATISRERNYAGGIAGSKTGVIIGCIVKSTTVSGRDYIGGIAGNTSSADLVACHAYQVNVKGTRNYAGGIVGSIGGVSKLVSCFTYECTHNDNTAFITTTNISEKDDNGKIYLRLALYYMPWTADHSGAIAGYTANDTATNWNDAMAAMNAGIDTWNADSANPRCNYKWSGADAASATLVVVE